MGRWEYSAVIDKVWERMEPLPDEEIVLLHAFHSFILKRSSKTTLVHGVEAIIGSVYTKSFDKSKYVTEEKTPEPHSLLAMIDPTVAIRLPEGLQLGDHELPARDLDPRFCYLLSVPVTVFPESDFQRRLLYGEKQ